MWASGRMINFMEREFILRKMDKFMKVTTLIIRNKAMAYKYIQTFLSTKVNGLRINFMVME